MILQKPTCVWDIRGTHDSSDLLHILQVRRKSTVAAKYLFIDQRSNGQTIEAIGECLPQLDRKSSLA
jgi:hypothetical protein